MILNLAKKAFLITLLVLTGCNTGQHSELNRQNFVQSGDIIVVEWITISEIAADLAMQLTDNKRHKGIKITNCVVTTPVDINNLAKSSSFGRLLAEELGNEVFKLGMDITDIRQARSINIQPGTGELILTRDDSLLLNSVGAEFIIAGTYSVEKDFISVTIRLLNITDRKIFSVATAKIAKTKAIKSLLTETEFIIPSSYDKI